MGNRREDAGYPRATAEHLHAIHKMASEGATSPTAIAAALVALGLAPLSRSTVSRVLSGKAHSAAPEAGEDEAEGSDQAEADEADASALKSVAGALSASGYFSDLDVINIKKSVAKKLRAIIDDKGTPAAVVVKAGGELSRLVSEIQGLEADLDAEEEREFQREQRRQGAK